MGFLAAFEAKYPIKHPQNPPAEQLQRRKNTSSHDFRSGGIFMDLWFSMWLTTTAAFKKPNLLS
jgi:hypothetical protein